jgi:hypothetical protein
MSRFELGVAYHRRLPFFKTAKPLKTLSAAHGILCESHFKSYRMFQCKFFVDLTKLNARSLFHFLGNSECDYDSYTPVLYLGLLETEKSYREGTKCQQVEACQNTLSRRWSLGVRSYRRNNTSLDTFWTTLIQ